MREKIIECALGLVDMHGIKFTLDDVAVTLRISKKTIYKHFKNKEDLINAIIDFVFADIHKQHQQILKKDISDVEKLKMIVTVYPSVIHFDTLKLNKLIELHPKIYERINKQLFDNWDLTLEMFDKCVENGSMRPISRECFRTVLLGIYDRAIHYEDHEKMTEECVDAVFNGFVNS